MLEAPTSNRNYVKADILLLMWNLSRTYRLAVFLVTLVPSYFAQGLDARLLSGLKWRTIGPYRGGRTRACAGVPSQPNVFYMGPVNGGAWKTDDYGRTWKPIFDDQSAILAVSHSSSGPFVRPW